jgi:hypothetical protein
MRFSPSRAHANFGQHFLFRKSPAYRPPILSKVQSIRTCGKTSGRLRFERWGDAHNPMRLRNAR